MTDDNKNRQLDNLRKIISIKVVLKKEESQKLIKVIDKLEGS